MATMEVSQELKQESQRNILARLGKIEGQIRGLQGMVRDGRECEQILTQLRAAQAALNSVSALVLKSYLTRCYSQIGESPNPEEVYRKLEKTVSLLTKFIGS
jgi:CsoR family transcriptional regulator, copper-sensing transcriptional repressor